MEMTTDYKKLFENACLVHFSSSSWQCSKVIHPAMLKDKVDIDSDWFKGRKYLINPELLGPIHTAQHQARNHIAQNSLPFPIQTISLVPKERIKVIDERLELFKTRFWACVNDFIKEYEPARTEARQVLGDLFDENDYPKDIEKRFKFEWMYFNLGMPGKASILTPEIYAKTKEKFQQKMEETRELALSALCTEFSEVVENLAERLNGNGGKTRMYKASMFNSLRDFLDDISGRNLFDDAKLKALSDQARTMIDGINPYQIQYSTEVRNKVHQNMVVLKTAIEESIVDLPKRKIRMAA